MSPTQGSRFRTPFPETPHCIKRGKAKKKEKENEKEKKGRNEEVETETGNDTEI